MMGRATLERAPRRIRLLGGFHVETPQGDVSMALNLQRVVAYVALHTTSVTRVRAAADLWPEATPGRSAANLRSALWRARDWGLLRADPRTIALEPGVVVDVHQLDAVAGQVFDGNMDSLRQVRDFHHELLPEWSDDWVTVERERLRQLELHVLEAGISWCIDEHRDGDAVDLAHRAIQLEPLRESSHRALIRCHLAHGNRSEALTQFRRLEQMLHDELGLAPEDATRDLVRPLLRSSANGRSGTRRAPRPTDGVPGGPAVARRID